MIQEVGARCTGCKACGDICPKGAISYKNNDDGFWYPIVNEEKCIRCGKCRNVCGAVDLIPENTDFTKLSFAAWNRNLEIRRNSTSGGIYQCFAKYVLENGGYIVGSVYTDDFYGAYHTYTDSLDDLPKIMGSKYFQSDTDGIYKTTKKLLQENKTVLFTGTPCQVVAVKKYLGKEYENLITVDFICRGVPSPKLQEMKLKLYESWEKSKIISFKDKSDNYAWVDFGEEIKFENGKTKFISRWRDDYFDAFVRRDLNIRNSCYECMLKGGNNSSEITMGDFWGIKGVTEKDKKNGVSALIINNQAGFDFIQKIKNMVYLEQRSIEEIKQGNPAYVKATKKPEKREEFFNAVNSEGLEKAVKRYCKKTRKENFDSIKKVICMKIRRWAPIFKVRKQLNLYHFIKFNYFCKNIKRYDDAFIVPLKGTVVQLDEKSEVELHGNLFLNYHPSYKRGNQTTLFMLGKQAKFIAENRVDISYNNTIVVNRNAQMRMGYLYSNIGTNIISNFSITFGNHVLIGRDVCIFDSDYHKIFNRDGEVINHDKEVIIEDNVWIGTRTMVLKGSHIGAGAIIGANSMVSGNIEDGHIYINKRESKFFNDNNFWER